MFHVKQEGVIMNSKLYDVVSVGAYFCVYMFYRRLRKWITSGSG